jgi:hypothetical protein
MATREKRKLTIAEPCLPFVTAMEFAFPKWENRLTGSELMTPV